MHLICSPAHLLLLMRHILCHYQRTFECSSFCSNPCTFASMSLPLLPCPCASALVFFTLYSSFVPYAFTYLPSSLLLSHCPCALSPAHFPRAPVSIHSPFFPFICPCQCTFELFSLFSSPCTFPNMSFFLVSFCLFPCPFDLSPFSQFPCTLCSSSPVPLPLILRY